MTDAQQGYPMIVTAQGEQNSWLRKVQENPRIAEDLLTACKMAFAAMSDPAIAAIYLRDAIAKAEGKPVDPDMPF